MAAARAPFFDTAHGPVLILLRACPKVRDLRLILIRFQVEAI